MPKPHLARIANARGKDSTPLEPRVLNRDFVEKNSGQLRGVFTLGEKQKNAEDKLVAAHKEQQSEQEKLIRAKSALNGEVGTVGKHGELATLETECQDKFWVPVQKRKQQGEFVLNVNCTMTRFQCIDLECRADCPPDCTCPP